MPTGLSATRAMNVLVVDDEPEILELLVEYFRDKGFEVASTGDGRSAVAAIEREPARYKLVMTDLQLPGADGLAVLRAAKRANPSCYVVIITGYASLDSAIQAVRFGAYDYLTKPFSMGQIDVIVQRVTDRLALEAENRLLSRQLGVARPSSDGEPAAQGPAVVTRLDAIEAKLARVETLIAALGDRLRQP